MEKDPFTDEPIPANAIQRLLYLAPKVHIYQIPPATSTKGYEAATWTTDPRRKIFTGRLRILETSIPAAPASTSNNSSSNNNSYLNADADQEPDEKVTSTILFEDSSSGELFVAAPYNSPKVVEQAIDSSRFFAVTVPAPDGGGRKTVLGMGFEDRSDAFDFSIALQDARRVLGMEKNPHDVGNRARGGVKVVEEPKRDFSLKEGETISINFGGLKGRRSRPESSAAQSNVSEQDALFSIKPPPGPGNGGSLSFLPAPPSARSVKEERRRSRQAFEQPKPQDFGFDDGEFGEFQ